MEASLGTAKNAGCASGRPSSRPSGISSVEEFGDHLQRMGAEVPQSQLPGAYATLSEFLRGALHYPGGASLSTSSQLRKPVAEICGCYPSCAAFLTALEFDDSSGGEFSLRPEADLEVLDMASELLQGALLSLTCNGAEGSGLELHEPCAAEPADVLLDADATTQVRRSCGFGSADHCAGDGTGRWWDVIQRAFVEGGSFVLRGATYVVDRKLGVGGFGVIFAVRNQETGQSFAAKMLSRERAESLIVEVLAYSALAGTGAVFTPTLVAMGEVRMAASCTFLVLLMEQANSTLSDAFHLFRETHEKLVVVTILARTLESLHSVGLVHQDLKPDNVLIDTNAFPLVADFGCVSTMASWQQRLRPLDDGAVVESVGYTPMYAAPEVLGSGGFSASSRSDVWAWALVALEVFGVTLPPFSRHAGQALTRKEAARSAASELQGVPDGLRDLLVECLQESRHKRPDSSALCRRLECLGVHQRPMGDVYEDLEETRRIQLEGRIGRCFGHISAGGNPVHVEVQLHAFELLHDEPRLADFVWSFFAVHAIDYGTVHPKTAVLLSIRDCTMSQSRAAQDFSPDRCAARIAAAAARMPADELRAALRHPQLAKVQPDRMRAMIFRGAASASCGDARQVFLESLTALEEAWQSPETTNAATEWYAALVDNAVQAGDMDGFMALAAEGVQLDAAGCSGLKPVHRAAMFGHVEILGALAAFGMRLDDPDFAGKHPVHYAAGNGHAAAVEALISHGVAVDVADALGDTPLTSAALAGCAEVVQKFAALGVPVETRSIMDGASPVHCAAVAGHLAVLDVLAAHGASLHCRMTNGWTIAHGAACKNQVEFIAGLAQRGYRFSRRDCKGNTPLHFAVAVGNVDMVKVMAASGTGLDVPDSQGLTPAHQAVVSGSVAALQVLSAHGADLQALDASGRTPADLALLSGRHEIYEMLAAKASVQLGHTRMHGGR